MEVHNKPLDGNPFLKDEDPYASVKAKRGEVDPDTFEWQRRCYELWIANPDGVELRKMAIERVMQVSMMNIAQLPNNPDFIAAYEMGFKQGAALYWLHGDVHARRIAGVNG